MAMEGGYRATNGYVPEAAQPLALNKKERLFVA